MTWCLLDALLGLGRRAEEGNTKKDERNKEKKKKNRKNKEKEGSPLMVEPSTLDNIIRELFENGERLSGGGDGGRPVSLTLKSRKLRRRLYLRGRVYPSKQAAHNTSSQSVTQLQPEEVETPTTEEAVEETKDGNGEEQEVVERGETTLDAQFYLLPSKVKSESDDESSRKTDSLGDTETEAKSEIKVAATPPRIIGAKSRSEEWKSKALIPLSHRTVSVPLCRPKGGDTTSAESFTTVVATSSSVSATGHHSNENRTKTRKNRKKKNMREYKGGLTVTRSRTRYITYSDGASVVQKLGRQLFEYERLEEDTDNDNAEDEEEEDFNAWENRLLAVPPSPPRIAPSLFRRSSEPVPTVDWDRVLPDGYNPLTWLYRHYSKTKAFVKGFSARE